MAQGQENWDVDHRIPNEGITCALTKNWQYLKYKSIDGINLIKCLKWKEFLKRIKMVPAPTSFPHINS